MWQPHEPNSRHSSLGGNSSDSGGTGLTSGGSADTKGSWVDVGGVTPFAFEALTIYLNNSSAAFSDSMLDVGVSDGSNRYNVISDLYAAVPKLREQQGLQIYIPVYVAAGAQLSARMAAATASSTLDIVIIGHSSGLGGAPGFSRCVALFTPSSSRGIAVDPGGTANTKGSWAEITSSCPNDIGAMFGLFGFNNDTSRAAATAAMLLDIGIGAGGAEFVLYPNAGISWGTTSDGPFNCPRLPLFSCAVPSGTRIAARAQCSDNTASDRTVDLALYGLVL